jgi:hypothetical protein
MAGPPEVSCYAAQTVSKRIRDGQTQCPSRTRSSSSSRRDGSYLPVCSSCISSCSPRTEVPEYLLSSHSLLISFDEYGSSWTGIFDWTLRLDSSLDLDLDLDLKYTRSRVVLSFLGIVIAHRLSRTPSHLIHFRRVFRRRLVPNASRSFRKATNSG